MSNANIEARIKGVILECIRDGHRHMRPKMDDISMWGFLMDMGYAGVGQNETIMHLDDLCERGMLRCKRENNSITGRPRVSSIEITPKGRDVLNGIVQDPAILV